MLVRITRKWLERSVKKNNEETKVTKQKNPRVRKLVDELASLSTTIPHAIDAEFASIEVVAV